MLRSESGSGDVAVLGQHLHPQRCIALHHDALVVGVAILIGVAWASMCRLGDVSASRTVGEHVSAG